MAVSEARVMPRIVHANWLVVLVLALAVTACRGESESNALPLAITPTAALTTTASVTQTGRLPTTIAATVTPTPEPEAFHAVAFQDAMRGWAAGDMGILFTGDGGRTWQLQHDEPVQRLGIISEDAAWAIASLAVGDPNERLLVTSDGGTNWRDSGDPPGSLYSVSFVTPELGWAVAAGVEPDLPWLSFIQTIDGGRTWAPVEVEIGQGAIRDICFEDAASGWATVDNRIDRFAGIMKTQDGGLTWTKSLSHQGSAPDDVQCAPGSVWARFVCCHAAFHSRFLIFKSEDGGSSWDAVVTNQLEHPTAFSVRSASGGSYAVANDETASVVGWCAPCQENLHLSLFLTADGGVAWRPLTVPPLGDDFVTVALADSEHGWIASTGGQIFATTDGGQSWQMQYDASR